MLSFYTALQQHCLALQSKSTAVPVYYWLCPLSEIPYTTLAALISRLSWPQNDSPSTIRQDPSNSLVCYGSVNSSPFNTAATMQPKAIRNRKGSVKGDCRGNTLLKQYFHPQRLEFNFHFSHKWATGFIPNLILYNLLFTVTATPVIQQSSVLGLSPDF